VHEEKDIMEQIAREVEEIQGKKEAEKPEKAVLPQPVYDPKVEKLADEVRMLRAVSTVLLSFIAVLCIAVAAAVIVSAKNTQKNVIDNMPQIIEQTEAASASKIELELAQVYKSLEGLGNVVYGSSDDMILLDDATYGEIWLPTLKEVEKSPYDTSLFYEENGVMYYDDENVQTFHGIDVSNYQGDIDWEKVKADGVDFAMIRVGYRGYSAGTVMEDERCRQNLKGATEAGVDVGVYFFSQATTVQEAIEEAWMVLDCIEGYDITYPIVFDWEIIFGESARTDGIPVSTLNQAAVAFCDVIESKGYKAMVYFNKRLGLLKYNLADLKDYEFWFAQYYDIPEFYYKFDMWQYSSTGRVDGIDGEVDMNICFTDYSSQK